MIQWILNSQYIWKKISKIIDYNHIPKIQKIIEPENFWKFRIILMKIIFQFTEAIIGISEKIRSTRKLERPPEAARARPKSIKNTIYIPFEKFFVWKIDPIII